MRSSPKLTGKMFKKAKKILTKIVWIRCLFPLLKFYNENK